MNKVLLTFLSTSVLLTGCVQKQVRPDNPEFAPITPAQFTQPQAVNGSIYNAATNINLYSDGRAHRVGDIITVTLQESTSSQKEANTEIDKEGSIQLTQPVIAGRGATAFGQPLSFNVPSPTTTFEGESSVDQSNSLSGSITVTVHNVLPNGTLMVKGEKWLTLNQGDEYIRISGMIRPQDIQPDNTIQSNRVADARIAYSGTGTPHDSNVMGWLSKFFVSALMPF